MLEVLADLLVIRVLLIDGDERLLARGVLLVRLLGVVDLVDLAVLADLLLVGVLLVNGLGSGLNVLDLGNAIGGRLGGLVELLDLSGVGCLVRGLGGGLPGSHYRLPFRT